MGNKLDYVVVEDGGGGLHLYVFKEDGDAPFVKFSGFEYQKPGVLVACLDALDQGDDTSTWEGKEDPAEDWAFAIQPHGGKWIVTGIGHEGRVIHPDRMGVAGAREFGIDQD